MYIHFVYTKKGQDLIPGLTDIKILKNPTNTFGIMKRPNSKGFKLRCKNRGND